jgi:hypothetical protein
MTIAVCFLENLAIEGRKKPDYYVDNFLTVLQ